MGRRRGKKKTRKLSIVLTALFAVVFLVSAYMAVNAILGLKRADEEIARLRSQVSTTKAPAEAPTQAPDGDDASPAPDATASEPEETPEAPDVTPEAVPTETPAPAPKEPVRQAAMDFQPLKAVSGEIVGWIRGEGTPIDYPILRADDNAYYLNHLYNGETNKSGSIFMDYRDDPGMGDRNIVLYGHHMGDGSMFASLEKYKAQEYYDSVPTYTLYTPEGDYLIELICGTTEDGNYEFVRFDFESDDDLAAYVESFRKRSTFQSGVTLQPGDRIISLCTCTYDRANARYMVIGRLVPLYE